MNAKRLRVAVFGVGGVGGYFGARLASVGVDVVFIARGEHLAAIRSSGLRVTSVLGDLSISPPQATDSPAEAGPVDAVLLGVKTWQVPRPRRRSVRCSAPTLASCLCRTAWTRPRCSRRRSAQSTWSAERARGFAFSTGLATSAHRRGHVHQARRLDGRRSGRFESLRAAFERARVDVEVPADIRVALWEKLALVVPFGGIGAVARAPIGVLEERAADEAAARARHRRNLRGRVGARHSIAERHRGAHARDARFGHA